MYGTEKIGALLLPDSVTEQTRDILLPRIILLVSTRFQSHVSILV